MQIELGGLRLTRSQSSSYIFIQRAARGEVGAQGEMGSGEICEDVFEASMVLSRIVTAEKKTISKKYSFQVLYKCFFDSHCIVSVFKPALLMDIYQFFPRPPTVSRPFVCLYVSSVTNLACVHFFQFCGLHMEW